MTGGLFHHAVYVGERDSAFEGRVGSSALELCRDLSQEAKRCAHGSRSYADSGHAELLQLRYRRGAWAGEDIYRTLQVFHETPDCRGVAQAGDEYAVGAGIAKRRQAPQGFVVALFRRADFQQINIGAGIEDDGQFPDGLHPFNLQRELQERVLRIAGGILKIHSDCAGSEDVAGGAGGIFRAIAISGFDVGGDRELDRLRDASDHRQHFFTRNALAVGISQGEGDAGAGGGDGAEAGLLNDAGAGDVPGVGQDEGVAVMQGAEGIRSWFFADQGS